VGIHTIANVGGEEPLRRPTLAVARSVARLWGLLFPHNAQALFGDAAPDAWPAALLPSAEAPAFNWIEDDAAHAWLNTEQARELARDAGVRLAGASPEAVRQVHDKGFAHAVAEEAGLLPRALRGLVTALAPEQLHDGARAVREIQERVQSWPDWTRGRFTLKPRLGSSGRGRVAGDALTFDGAALARSLPRLAERGGAMLEPWLEREADLSAQLYIAPGGGVTLLGTLELEVSDSGVYRGHRARLDHRLRLASGSVHDDALLEAAMIVARAAQQCGYHGPCGLDAFVFRGPDGSALRPAVELNARYTMGTIVAGLMRRCRPHLRRALPTEPGRLRELRFALTHAAAPAPGAAWSLPLGDASAQLEISAQTEE
jgi:hypothetical protein